MIAPDLVATTVETVLAAVAVSFAASLLVGAFVRAGSHAPAGSLACRPTYRMACGRELCRPGETYAGSVLDDITGRLTHIYRIPGKIRGDWRTAMAWAAAHGGTLPTRGELALLRDVAPPEFADYWFWSAEPHDIDVGWAWFMDFSTGEIGDEHKSQSLCAIAVRRVVV